MEELFAAIPQDDDGMSAEANRFEGALVALSAIGALDADWLEARDNAGTAPEPGGTEQDLVAVFGGSGVGSDSARVVVGLCFADGISLLVRNLDVSVEGDDWTQPELADNLDTRYRQVGQRDADAGEWFSFAPALPPGATWIELSEPSGNPIRISL
jgi:hypothetical protein